MQTEPPEADLPKRKRRWFQFSLRTLLVFTLVVAVGCALISRRVAQKRREREAVESLLKLGVGGIVAYGFQYDSSNHSIPNAEPPAPKWMQSLFGENFFSDVIYVHIPYQATPDTNKGPPKHWWTNALASLYPAKKPDADAGLAICEQFPQLRYLELWNTTVTDAGLAHFGKMPQLRDLNLSDTAVSDAGLAHVKGLPHLRGLDLSDTNVTDAGMAYLSELSELEVLRLSRTTIGDAGLEHLKRLARLRTLDLIRTKVSDAGVDDLQKFLPNCCIGR